MEKIAYLIDLSITLSLWLYFFGSFFLFYSLLPVILFLRRPLREKTIQRINNQYFKSFFWFFSLIAPRVRIDVSDKVRSIASSIVICNHISYLDPILLISIFKKQKTIVKGLFFRLPIMGQVLACSGYVPFSAHGKQSDRLFREMDALKRHLSEGGILFVFPEGRRSRSKTIQSFKKGAFSLAAAMHTPIEIICIRHSDSVFQPGKFVFNTRIPVTISIEYVGRLEAPSAGSMAGIKEARDIAYNLLANHLESYKL